MCVLGIVKLLYRPDPWHWNKKEKQFFVLVSFRRYFTLNIKKMKYWPDRDIKWPCCPQCGPWLLPEEGSVFFIIPVSWVSAGTKAQCVCALQRTISGFFAPLSFPEGECLKPCPMGDGGYWLVGGCQLAVLIDILKDNNGGEQWEAVRFCFTQ